ncbi:hypothetical protein Ddye_008219 [Dipteronia dyeriana]|uniref:Transposase (putative) gypsy type domain-containing protein n=1 Tax=Dipteronia dyeriana TaxID=168575 RepID=A0AAE0CL41_9ROSI|nr:hypothetical protein Ddye_008219 [Dipteronia dyeriana]
MTRGDSIDIAHEQSDSLSKSGNQEGVSIVGPQNEVGISEVGVDRLQTIVVGRLTTPGELTVEPPLGSRSEAGRFLTENLISRLSSQYINNLQFHFGIPESMKLRVATTFKRVDWSIPGWMCFFYLPFRIGLRFPIPPLARQLLNFFDIALSQLMPNGWRILLGLQVLIEKMDLEFSFKNFLCTY